MGRLSADHQAVLRMRYWDGLSFVEIGDRMSRSPDAVRKLWFRAVQRLQEEMGGTADELHGGPPLNLDHALGTLA
jgi:DNA-directed RNA polymerase specialized sigma24 family protein